MTEPKIVQHDNPSEVDGAYAYYERTSNEIHILNPGALYSRVLEHEMAHVHKRLPVRILLRIADANSLHALIGLALLMVALTIFSVGISAALNVGLGYFVIFLAGTVFTIPALLVASIGMENLEEFFAERAAIAKARKPKRGENPIP